ncbi:hypothetical protein [Bacillus sp. BC08]
MFTLTYQGKIIIEKVPIQWIPKIEIYYPDLPQFPIMYIHTKHADKRIIACPVSVNFLISGKYCDVEFTVLANYAFDKTIETILKKELQERIGFSKKISKIDIIKCCKSNIQYEKLMENLWGYIEKSYGETIPFGRYYEEIYSIIRFVSAWQPKTGRQSEMRMLYNFMSAFGEEVVFPQEWNHLEYYIVPNYEDAIKSDFSDFPKFNKLFLAIDKVFNIEFDKIYTVQSVSFRVMSKAWKQNKNDFINNVSKKLLDAGKISLEDKYYIELLVDAFNRHAWRAAYFISSFMNIRNSDYRNWTKNFFKDFYDNGSKLKGYSEKVIACFLQQGFGQEEIIPVDTWIETFHKYPLGIESRTDFYTRFNGLGKMERVIWLASQSNKTNMRDFFDILWCQRYGVIGNQTLRGVNPIACYGCKLKDTCVGLANIKGQHVYVDNDICEKDFDKIISDSIHYNIKFICILEFNIPKKVYKKDSDKWNLVDEFSGYILNENNKLDTHLVKKKIITIDEFTSNSEQLINVH